MSEHDIERCRDCMVELKARIAIFDQAALSFRRTKQVTVANTELACLQLRKVYELIAFSSLTANRGRYETVRRSFQKDWDLPRICKLIASKNPDFLPRPFKLKENVEFAPHLQGVSGDAPILSLAELIEKHGRLGSVLHAKNPYSKPTDYVTWISQCCEERDHLVSGLSNHMAIIEHEELFYSVSMNVDNTGVIQVMPWMAVETT